LSERGHPPELHHSFMRRLALAIAIVVVPLDARADEPRSVDFQGGFVLDQTPPSGFYGLPGVGLQLRWFPHQSLWLAGGASFEASADLRDPEHGEVASMLAIGGAGGAWVDLGSRITLFGGARLEYIRGWGWPDRMTERLSDVAGLRAGPTAAVAVMVAHAWGHPMYVEARLSWLAYDVAASDAFGGWQAGLYASGVLFPDR